MPVELWVSIISALGLIALYLGELRDRQRERDEEQRKRIAAKARMGHYDREGKP